MNRLTGWIYKCTWKTLQPVMHRQDDGTIRFEEVPRKKIEHLPYICMCNFYNSKRKNRLRKNNCKAIKVELRLTKLT